MQTELQTWYSDLTADQREITTALRRLVRTQGEHLREALKWGQPCFVGKSMVCYLQKAKRHVAIGFGRGCELADPESLLEGSGSQMRHVKIPLGSRLPSAALVRLIDQAIKLDDTK